MPIINQLGHKLAPFEKSSTSAERMGPFTVHSELLGKATEGAKGLQSNQDLREFSQAFSQMDAFGYIWIHSHILSGKQPVENI